MGYSNQVLASAEGTGFTCSTFSEDLFRRDMTERLLKAMLSPIKEDLLRGGIW